MIVRDSVRVKTDGKGTLRIVIMRDGNIISAILNYSFTDGKTPLEIASDATECEVASEPVSEIGHSESDGSADDTPDNSEPSSEEVK